MKLTNVLLGAVGLSLASAHGPKVPHGPQYSQVENLPNFTFLELYNLTVRFFDHFVYPADVKEAKKINSTLFSENVLGRVDATRDLRGRELNTEYTFGLWAGIALNPGEFTLLGIPESYKIVRFTGNQNIISVSAIIDFNITALQVVNPVELLFWATYNHEGQITQYDATFRWLEWQFDEEVNFHLLPLYDIGKKLFNVKTAAQVQNKTQPLLAHSICTTTQKYCVGGYQQYASYDACFNHLTYGMPFGKAYQLGFDTVLCRMVHQNMVPLRPDVHCPHVGPTGGGMCDNGRSYAKVVTQPYYKHQSYVPYGYQNKNKTIAAE